MQPKFPSHDGIVPLTLLSLKSRLGFPIGFRSFYAHDKRLAMGHTQKVSKKVGEETFRKEGLAPHESRFHGLRMTTRATHSQSAPPF